MKNILQAAVTRRIKSFDRVRTAFFIHLSGSKNWHSSLYYNIFPSNNFLTTRLPNLFFSLKQPFLFFFGRMDTLFTCSELWDLTITCLIKIEKNPNYP
jgi:hypothetical protein